ncbi:MAG: MoxR family ATPase [Myxococcota bacterium]|jgi:MoxR-like ATPase|nr:MoxR family ATPase [Myxococcota bacterium]
MTQEIGQPPVDEKLQKLCPAIQGEIGKVLVGQDEMVRSLLVGLLCGGHVLLEGLPGLAKTLAIQSLSRTIDTQFSRIQFTPDMLPADVIGTQIFNPGEGTFSVKQGPIFANLVLADEINRAPAKVQAALLEAMQEKQVTIGGESFPLREPFLVLATQNPIEQEGTYPLPEAQVDRFMLKVKIGYPSAEEERRILDRMASGQPIPEVQHVADANDILAARAAVDQLFVDEKARNYIVDIVQATRSPGAAGLADLEGLIEHGASPRASIALMKAAKAHAFIQGRSYVTPHDIQSTVPNVLRHRVAVSYEAEAEGISPEDVIQKIIDTLLVP